MIILLAILLYFTLSFILSIYVDKIFYSQAVLVENTLYVSGQIGMSPKDGNIVQGGVVPETEQVS